MGPNRLDHMLDAWRLAVGSARSRAMWRISFVAIIWVLLEREICVVVFLPHGHVDKQGFGSLLHLTSLPFPAFMITQLTPFREVGTRLLFLHLLIPVIFQGGVLLQATIN